jgi:hypothetical protein
MQLLIRDRTTRREPARREPIQHRTIDHRPVLRQRAAPHDNRGG